MTMSSNDTRYALNDFFVSVQVKALRQAEFAVKNRDDAFDILQDAMEKLARKYSDKPDEWGPLFQRILQNTIRDWYRRQKVRRFFSLSRDEEDSSEDLLDKHYSASEEPEAEVIETRQFAEAKQALSQLPYRQQQAFILRAWWGFDVGETAFAMSCSEGSVKTHYSRARSRLQQLLIGVGRESEQ